MIRLIKWIYRIIKSIILVIFNKNYRRMGLKWTRTAIDLASIIARHTRTRKDDYAIRYIQKIYDGAVEFEDELTKKNIGTDVTKQKKGPLKSISLSDNGKVGIDTNIGNVSWDTKNGDFKIGF